MNKRIIPISSGKGGVGKTTFAINLSLALARFGKTVLVDLDTGTSSVRNVIDVPVKRDLYHFFRRRVSLEECITPLTEKLDPQGTYARFGFVAAPRHVVDELTNLRQSLRNQLIDALNELNAQFVILDLKAGMDPFVVDFLPQSNSGILVFTPHHPAAVSSAASIVKSILFRKLRSFFYEGSPIFERFPEGKLDYPVVAKMISAAEDVYAPALPNLDALVKEFDARYPGHPVIRLVSNMISLFRVFYVLNRYEGLAGSFQSVVQPFVRQIAGQLSPRISIQNLGWIQDSDRLHQSNISGVPFVLNPIKQQQPAKKPEPRSQVEEKLAELYSFVGKKEAKPASAPAKEKAATKETAKAVATRDALFGQLQSLEKIYRDTSQQDEAQNFEYIVSRIRYFLRQGMVSDLGEKRLYKRGEMVPLFPMT